MSEQVAVSGTHGGQKVRNSQVETCSEHCHLQCVYVSAKFHVFFLYQH